MLYVIAMAVETVVVKRAISSLRLSTWSLVLYNNALALGVSPLGTYLSTGHVLDSSGWATLVSSPSARYKVRDYVSAYRTATAYLRMHTSDCCCGVHAGGVGVCRGRVHLVLRLPRQGAAGADRQHGAPTERVCRRQRDSPLAACITLIYA